MAPKLEFSLPPFSATGIAERAKAHALPLEQANWMLEQPMSYGIDAGRAVNENGELIGIRRLEDIVPQGKWREAAVLVPIVAREPEVSVLFTLRPPHLNSHAGQVSFPGGKIDESDTGPVAAALREAEEEVGLSPALATPLGLLDLHNTGTGFRIVPVLGLIDPQFIPIANAQEVAAVFEIPLSFLMIEKNHLQHYLEWKGQRILFYAMSYENRFIWGATAAILRNLFERLYRS